MSWNRDEKKETSWGEVLGMALGAIGAGVAIGSLLYQAAKSGDEEKEATQSNSTLNVVLESGTNAKDVITIAVDATPDKCGGFIIFPKEMKIYYYSSLWKPYFSFSKVSSQQEPGIFEMLNCLVAMTEFEDKIEKYRRRYNNYEKIIVKVDNNFSLNKRKANPTSLRGVVEEKTEELNGELLFVMRSEDQDMKLADKLSRNFGNQDAEGFIGQYYIGYDVIHCPLNNTLQNVKGKYERYILS